MSREGEFVARIGRAASVFFRFSDNADTASTEGLTNETSLKLKPRNEVLSPSHAKLYRSLAAALSADAVVFAKVRLADFLTASAGGNSLEVAIKMDRKCVDFLLCDPFTMKPLAVVELVSPATSSEIPAIEPKENFVTRSLRDAKIKHLRIQSRPHYPIEELRRLILSKINLVQTTGSPLSESSVSELPVEKELLDRRSDSQYDVSNRRLAGRRDESLGHIEKSKSLPAIISHRIATA